MAKILIVTMNGDTMSNNIKVSGSSIFTYQNPHLAPITSWDGYLYCHYGHTKKIVAHCPIKNSETVKRYTRFFFSSPCLFSGTAGTKREAPPPPSCGKYGFAHSRRATRCIMESSSSKARPSPCRSHVHVSGTTQAPGMAAHRMLLQGRNAPTNSLHALARRAILPANPVMPHPDGLDVYFNHAAYGTCIAVAGFILCDANSDCARVAANTASIRFAGTDTHADCVAAPSRQPRGMQGRHVQALKNPPGNQTT